jgi:hypothetical protein
MKLISGAYALSRLDAFLLHMKEIRTSNLGSFCEKVVPDEKFDACARQVQV